MPKTGATETAESIDTTSEFPKLPPVELDDQQSPPTPELIHWRDVVDRNRDRHLMIHGGDASKLLPFPRPAWCDPDRDYISAAPRWCKYRSELVEIPATRYDGQELDDEIVPASVTVSAHINGAAERTVALGTTNYVKSKEEFKHSAIHLNLDEAVEVASVLLAAVNLALSGDQ